MQSISNLRNNKYLKRLLDYGADVYLVGGTVRDNLLGLPPKDIDLEVFGITAKELEAILPEANLVGSHFGVYKLGELDIALPRKEKRTGNKHTDFQVEVDPFLSTIEASKRRDFTINSMMQNIVTGEIIDHFKGQEDLENNILRATSENRFAEDVLRVLRGFQFCGRFDLEVFPKDIELFQNLKSEYQYISKERIWIEWEKWASKSIKPSRGLELLKQTEWLEHYPALDILDTIPQDKQWHPEGNVWQHTLQAVDNAVYISNQYNLNKFRKLVLVFAALLHDIGKANTTKLEADNRLHSYGHEKQSEILAEDFLTSIDAPKNLIKRVLPLIRFHGVLGNLKKVTRKFVRKLTVKLNPATIEDLVYLIWIDKSSRYPLPKAEFENQLLELAKELQIENNVPKHILLGRHLIELGMEPSKEFGVILNQAYEAQLDGEFNNLEQGKEWLKGYRK